MNVIDIIVGVLLLYSFWRGWRSGILVQLGGIAGVILGAWLAFRFSEQVGAWLSIATDYKWLAFLLVLIVVMIAVIMLCKFLTRILENGGLSLPIRMLGAVASTLKVIVILALILQLFESINQRTHITDESYLHASYTYKPLSAVSGLAFPYMSNLLGEVESANQELSRELQQKIESEVDKQVREHLEKMGNEK